MVTSILANRELGMQLKEQAVLFRGSHHSDRLELELVRRNIPYVKYGGLKFLEAAHVKDLLAAIKDDDWWVRSRAGDARAGCLDDSRSPGRTERHATPATGSQTDR